MSANLRTESGLQLRAIRDWIVNHDESWLFIIAYIGLAVVLSIWISLFWLVAVVAVHFAFEWIRQQSLRSGFSNILLEVLWELKLDIALVLFALALSLYMEVVLGVVGLRSVSRLAPAAQAGLRGSARFAAWQRIIRGVLLSVDDAAQVARAVAMRGGQGEEAEVAAETAVPATPLPANDRSSWRGRWGVGDWIAAGMAGVCVLLILFAPTFTDHTFASTLTTLAAELHPLPTAD